MPNSWNFAFAN